MAEKGFLSNAQEKALANMVDDAIKAKGVLELVDGIAAKILITMIDDQVLGKINAPEELKAELSELADAVIAKDWEEAQDITSDIANSYVDIPGIDEDTEKYIFHTALGLIAGLVKKAAESKGSQPGGGPGNPDDDDE